MLSMKNIKLYCVALLVLLINPGCEKFLDKSPDLGLSESAVYKDYNSIRGFLDVCFGNLEEIMVCYNNGNERSYVGLFADEMATLDNASTAL